MSSPADSPAPSVRQAILAIALPSILTNVATALFGLADMWVIGRLGDASAQGAVEVGAKLLMVVLIVFNFLRSSTIALTAQAAGRADVQTQAATLTRALAVALGIGVVLLLFRPVLVPLALEVFGATGKVATLARTYVDIRYFGGVAWLLNAVLVGWLIGRRKVRHVLVVEIGANLFHVALDVTLVLGLGLGVGGVAVATLCSEIAKLLALAVVVAREAPARQAVQMIRQRTTWRAPDLGALFRLNRDLFIRTLLLMAAPVLLTRAGAQQGATVLAANAILFQLFMLATMILDGFESAAQVLCGEAVGSGDRQRFDRIVRSSMLYSAVAAVLVAAVYGAFGAPIAAGFSTDPAVVATTALYVGWAALLPLAGTASFVFDGVFIGASWTRAMVISMAIALVLFVGALHLARPLGNHGLWLVFCLFFVARAAAQAVMVPGLARRSFATAGAPMPSPN
jgi:MATE family multidrug resistance protein